MRKLITPIVLIVVLLGVYFMFFSSSDVEEGEKTPDVSATLVSGEKFKLSDLKGKTVYLVFWGSWCPPCRAELPHWVEYYHTKNNDNIEIVSIALEKKKGQSSRVAEALNFPWKYQIEEVSGFVALNEFSRKYGVSDIPAAFKINPDGTLAKKIKGTP